MLQWLAVVVEFLGLVLVAIELYFPVASERLKQLFEGDRSRSEQSNQRSVWLWLVPGYVVLWIAIAAAASLQDPMLNILVNGALTAITILLGLLLWLARAFVWLGVVMGRGNAVGGVGLVLALIGVSLEISQLIVS